MFLLSHPLARSILLNSVLCILILLVGSISVLILWKNSKVLPLLARQYKTKIQRVCTQCFVGGFFLVMFLLVFSRTQMFCRYDCYKINGHRLDFLDRLVYIIADCSEQETIIIETDANIYTATSVSGFNNEAYVQNLSYSICIPVGKVYSDYYQRVVSLLFEEYDMPSETNTLEVYKNSYLIKAINGVDLTDDERIEEFITTRKKGIVDGVLLRPYLASLDVTEYGIVVNPIHKTQAEYLKNDSLALCFYKWNPDTQEYELFNLKNLDQENISMTKNETGKFKIFVVEKADKKTPVSDIIECETQNDKIISLQIVTGQNTVIKTIDNIDSAAVLDGIDYNEDKSTPEERAEKALQRQLYSNNRKIAKRYLETMSSDIFMNIQFDVLYFSVIHTSDGKPTDFPLNLEGYYNKHQRENRDLLAKNQHGMLFAVMNTNGVSVLDIPLKDVDANNMSLVWNQLTDGEYVIQMKSTVIPEVCSNRLLVIIQDHQMVQVYDFDVEDKPLLWDKAHSSKQDTQE